MRIDWLNDDLTEARVTRGFWRWSRVAHVQRKADGNGGKYDVIYWFHVAANMWCESELNARLETDRTNERTWKRLTDAATAKVVRR